LKPLFIPTRCDMKVMLSRGKKGQGADDRLGFLSEWMGPDAANEEGRAPSQPDTGTGMDPSSPENRPIEPEKSRFWGPGILKWVFFLLIVAYAVVSYYHVPILTAMGNYLILRHPTKAADLIVCTPGPPLEQGLTAADLYHQGLAPLIYIPREPPPAGLRTLLEKGGTYPETSELFIQVLKGMAVPESAWVVGIDPVDGVREEAEELGEWLQRGEVGSLIVVTPPWRARRTHTVFTRILGKKEGAILMAPSRYSDFQAHTWWQHDRYKDLVIIEYQRLFCDAVRGIW
jgi:hypothetical protein